MMAFAGFCSALFISRPSSGRSLSLRTGRGWLAPVALTLGRTGAAVVFLALAARLGAASLLAAFLGFLLARSDGAARGTEGWLMQASPLASTVLFHLGPIAITRPVVTTWVIMLVLTAVLLAA